MSAVIPGGRTILTDRFVVDAGRYPNRDPVSWIAIGTIASAPIIWVLGVSAFAYHVAALTALVVLIGSGGNRQIRVGLSEALLLMYCIVYGVSLLVNWGLNETERLLASMYNWSLWVTGVVMVLVGRNINYSGCVLSLARAATWLVFFIVASSAVALILWFNGHQNPTYRSFASLIWSGEWGAADRFDLMTASTRLTLLTTDWLKDSFVPRATVLAPYPVALAGLLLCCLPLVVARISWGGRPALMPTVVGVLGLSTLILTLSRIAVVGVVFAWILVWAVGRFGVLFVSAAGLVMSVLLIGYVMPFVEGIFWLREGSTLSRLEIYAVGFDMAANTAPLFGLGVKPRASSFEVPIGSHSTYVGAFVKTGIVGAIAVIALSLRLSFCALRAAAKAPDRLTRALSVSTLGMVIWMSAEDIDAPQLVAFVFWLQVGLLERRIVGAGAVERRITF